MSDFILKDVLGYMSHDEMLMVDKAYQFAKKAHEGQYRQSGEPFIEHPVEVARLLATMRLDVESIQAALMHDVIEDTDVSKEDIRALFGETVADLVDGVTKLTQIKFDSRLEAQAENFRKMLLAMVKDVRIILIKLADRYHNMHTVHALSVTRRKRIAKETLEIYSQIANRLGMHELSLKLEDLGFQAIYPMRYRILSELLANMQGNHDNMVVDLCQEIETKLKEKGIEVEQILGREKHVYSIYRKMRDKGLSFTAITDFFGVRVVAPDRDACYRILGVVHQMYKPIPERFKDYIALPKPNGYQSLHTVLFGPYGVPVEVQIRTEEMDKISAKGLAAHWIYKSGDESMPAVDQHGWVSRLLDIQNSTEGSKDFIEHVKIDLYPEAIYVFTPKGKIIELPTGASAMDFAYAIHTDIGNHCVAAKVDRHLVPLSTTLVNGNTIEIIVSANAKPNPAWLTIVTTAKAQTGIRKYLKEQKEKHIESIGQQVVRVALRRAGFSNMKAQDKNILAQACGADDFQSLLRAVGQGDMPLDALIEQARNIMSESHRPAWVEKDLGVDAFHPYQLTGTEDEAVIYASCCLPVPHDPVIGVRQSNGQLEVHRQTCATLKQIQGKNIERCVPLSWSKQITRTFRAALLAQVVHQRGALATLTLAIADMESNIIDLKIRGRDRHFTLVVDVMLEVSSDAHLAKIIRSIARSPVVINVERLKNV